VRSQTVIWTALPNGRGASAGTLNLSVFVMPRLQTDEGGATPRLSLFPDFTNWPTTIGAAPSGPLSFTVTFGALPPVTATAAPGSPVPSARHWAAIFDPATTGVQPWQYFDLSDVPLRSFPARAVEGFLRDAYTSIGRQHPTDFPSRGSLLDGPFNPARPGNLNRGQGTPKGLGSETLSPPRTVPPGPPGGTAAGTALGLSLDFHTRPEHDPGFKPTTPTLDFHQALSMLKAYPRLLRTLGLVFDLVVPVPAGLPMGTTTVKVTPAWHPLLAGTGTSSQDATPLTNCTIDAAGFRATPRGTDYANGMLNLADSSRFSVIEVDVDGGAERASMFAAALEQTIRGGTDDTADDYAPPSLRSLGLSVVWSDWAGALSQLAAAQTAKEYQLEQSLTDPTVPLPVFDAEDLVRGHRIDVYSSEPSPAWRSLVARVGRYHFPKDSSLDFSDQDEGAVVAGGTQAAGTVEPPPPDLYVHETLARWSGWSLAARRPGRQILPAGEVGGDPANPLPPTDPNAGGVTHPQLSVSFTATRGSLPKLRFGNSYRFRARAADLAGNGVPLDSADGTTSIPAPNDPPVAHLRFDPVAAPVLAPVAVYGPGQGAQLVAILDYSDGRPVAPLGLWLFPPKGSELLAEEHGMFDGFVRGSSPDPAKGPSAATATYNLIVAREHASLADGTLPGSAIDPVRGTPYFTAAKLSTPWLPDPLSAGATMVGLPGDPAGAPTTRPWAGGPWPDPEPMLLQLSAGPSAGHAYRPSSPTTSAVEAVVLPPAGVADVALSSTLAAGDLDLMGMWRWITDGLDAGTVSSLRAQAAAGQMWLLSPFRVVRLVHAVRLPLTPPAFGDPHVARSYGSHRAAIDDATFSLDAPSTGTLDVEATWSDPLDDPTTPSNDPSTATTPTHTDHAFRLTVPDPSRPDASRPAFAVDEGHGAVHDLGDTKHHTVTYAATGTSRFGELFRQTVTVSLTAGTPHHLSDLGLDAGSVRLTADNAALQPGTDFTVDAVKGDVTLVKTGQVHPVAISYIPTDAVKGPPRTIEVLASARPAPPQVARVVPAWELVGPYGNLTSGGVNVTRRGGFLRIYLERPWFSSGAGELLGVVTLPVNTTAPTELQRPLVTLVGRDPITTSESSTPLEQSPASVSDFIHIADVPPVPDRPQYDYTPVVGLAEDPFGAYNVFPYEVRYDKETRLWFADVGINLGSGSYAPPAGFFVRLALVRFQPFAVPAQPGISEGAEVSPVVLATVAQPVPDRFVSVSLDPADPSNQTAIVTVSGPAYSGWRPPVDRELDGSGQAIQYDRRNSFARGVGDNLPAPCGEATSAMVVEVQVMDTSTGLSGDLAWRTVPGATPTLLRPTFSTNGSGMVEWGAGPDQDPCRTTGSGGPPPPPANRVHLPQAAPGPMRLRISEIDFPRTFSAPTVVDTSLRRPFITFIPLS